MKSAAVATVLCLSAPSALGFAFVPSTASRSCLVPAQTAAPSTSRQSSSSLSMVDTNILMGAGIAVAGVGAGIGFLAFAESMGERGGGLSDDMATRITGGLMEDVEVDSVADLSSLTEKLEAALKETGGADEKDLVMTEEDKKRIADEADDGW